MARGLQSARTKGTWTIYHTDPEAEIDIEFRYRIWPAEPWTQWHPGSDPSIEIWEVRDLATGTEIELTEFEFEEIEEYFLDEHRNELRAWYRP